MTTMLENEIEYCICGETSCHVGIGSTNSFGSPDLDTRPPEMQQSTINYGLQCCPSCDYCASDLSQCDESTREIVESKEYQSIIENNKASAAAPFLAVSYERQ